MKDHLLKFQIGTGQCKQCKMKTLNNYINEWKANNDSVQSVNKYKIAFYPKDFFDLKQIVKDKMKSNPTYLNMTDVDVSKITIFYNNFGGRSIFDSLDCEIIDVSGWNMSNATDISFLFYHCTELKKIIGLSDWDVSKVACMKGMFRWCQRLQTVDVSKWNVGNVQDTSQMFKGCQKIKIYGLENWNLKRIQDMSEMFDFVNEDFIPSWYDKHKWSK